jgi:hypothetical protein
MFTTEKQETESKDLSRFQAFVRSAARAPGMRPGRTWLTATADALPTEDDPRTTNSPS